MASGLSTKIRRPARPCSVFVPENYEPNYAYPLIVWLHETGRSERDIAAVLPQISMRNYIGLSLRGTTTLAGSLGYGWSRSPRAIGLLEDELQLSVRCVRQKFHVNTERVFLAGAGAGATAAWQIFLSHPEWFAGLAALGGEFPWRHRPLRRYHALRGRHVFLGTNAQNSLALAHAKQAGRLLHSAGLSVALCPHRAGDRLAKSTLRQLDCWIMAAIGGCL